MKKMLIMAFLANLISGCGSEVLETAKSWGAVEFTPERWQESNPKERSQMVYSFLVKHEMESLSPEEVMDILGKPTAYYEYDEFPAYEIVVDNKRFIMAFPIDRKTQLVRKLVFEPPL